MRPTTRPISCFTLDSRSEVPRWPRKYFDTTTLVASCDQPFGISQSRCSKISSPRSFVMVAERSSHSTSSKGCTPGRVKTRSSARPPAAAPPELSGRGLRARRSPFASPSTRPRSVRALRSKAVLLAAARELDPEAPAPAHRAAETREAPGKPRGPRARAGPPSHHKPTPSGDRLSTNPPGHRRDFSSPCVRLYSAAGCPVNENPQHLGLYFPCYHNTSRILAVGDPMTRRPARRLRNPAKNLP